MLEIEDSPLTLLSYGSEAYVQAKGKKNKLSSSSAPTDELTGTVRLLTGKRSVISLDCGSKPGDPASAGGSSLRLMPGSEAEVSISGWDSTKEREHHHGKTFSKIKLITGVFMVSSAGEYSTPTARFGPQDKATSLIIEIKPDGSTVFGLSGTKVKFTCIATGTTKELQSKTGSAEMIIMRDGIYKKSLVDLDERFSRMRMLVPSLCSFAAMGTAVSDKASPFPSPAPNAFDAAAVVTALERFKTLDPKTIPGLTPEQVRQIEESQKDMAYMEMKSGKKLTDQLVAAQRQRDEEIRKDPKMADMMKNYPKMMQEAGKTVSANLDQGFADYEKLPPYPPLHKDFKIA